MNEIIGCVQLGQSSLQCKIPSCKYSRLPVKHAFRPLITALENMSSEIRDEQECSKEYDN